MAVVTRFLGAVVRTVFVLLLFGTTSLLHAEGISGVVADGQGGVLPGVTVTVRNVETGITRTLVTGANGRYEAINLPVGRYDVEATLEQFKTTVRQGIVLTVGRDEVVDMVMELGEMAEQVVVTGEAPLVDTTSAAVSASFAVAPSTSPVTPPYRLHAAAPTTSEASAAAPRAETPASPAGRASTSASVRPRTTVPGPIPVTRSPWPSPGRAYRSAKA